MQTGGNELYVRVAHHRDEKDNYGMLTVYHRANHSKSINFLSNEIGRIGKWLNVQ
jgi:hypothetical protein